jgi:hypothetical protein
LRQQAAETGSKQRRIQLWGLSMIACGQFQALTLTETVTVTDGTLDLDFNTLAGSTMRRQP